MNKLMFLLFLNVSSSLRAYGQFFVGGSLGYSANGGSYEDNGTTTDKSSSMNVTFNPQGGYIISEDLHVGTYLSFGISHSNSHTDPEFISNTTSYGIQPFIRYYAFRFNKFSLFGQGQTNAGFSITKTKTGDTTEDGPKTASFGLSVFPGMAFDINDKVQLMASINAFSLSLSHSIEKEDDIVDRSTYFGFGANLNSILTSGNVTVGAIIIF